MVYYICVVIIYLNRSHPIHALIPGNEAGLAEKIVRFHRRRVFPQKPPFAGRPPFLAKIAVISIGKTRKTIETSTVKHTCSPDFPWKKPHITSFTLKNAMEVSLVQQVAENRQRRG